MTQYNRQMTSDYIRHGLEEVAPLTPYTVPPHQVAMGLFDLEPWDSAS